MEAKAKKADEVKQNDPEMKTSSQIDCDAGFFKKAGKTHYGCKLHIKNFVRMEKRNASADAKTTT